MKKLCIILGLITVTYLSAQARLKDISKMSGMDGKQLVGYGIVTGLQGTGDTPASQAAIQSIKNMLEHFSLSVPENRIRPNNSAAVMITATMPPFAAPGTTFDVNVSSIADARNLEGGILIMSPLIGTDNVKYALAQGPISIGGSNEDARGANNKVRQNYRNTGRIPNGAVVEVNNSNNLINDGDLTVLLHQPDFTTAERVVTAINELYNIPLANAENASKINIIVPDNFILNNNLVAFIASLENLEIQADQVARVVINERTGTIVAGGNVRITSAVIAHGNLMLKINDELNLGPYYLEMLLEKDRLGKPQSRFFELQSATVAELAQALNAIKVTPRDMIAIFQSLKETGALMAELRIL